MVLVDIQKMRPLRLGEEKRRTRNVGQCPTWWPPCRI